ncbi:Ltp family lipoprotein [Jeotgalicoccus aerolatus]|nr:Ltp family lipoprotein [Jeotgalicoccus aerolatus]GGD95183.1 hypothetical protein GCM10007273_04370 [Jeotgalicoccus aerolatus]
MADQTPHITNKPGFSETDSGEVPREWESALNSAYNYAEIMSMSKAGIYDQLVSEYGEQFTPEEAQYAIDNPKYIFLLTS